MMDALRMAQRSTRGSSHGPWKESGMVLIILGLLLAGGVGAFSGLVIAYNTAGGPRYTPEIFGQSLATLNTLGVFVAGIALGLIFSFGLWLIAGGTRQVTRSRRFRRVARYRRPGISSGLGSSHHRPQPY
jgi:hypothetical protein